MTTTFPINHTLVNRYSKKRLRQTQYFEKQY